VLKAKRASLTPDLSRLTGVSEADQHQNLLLQTESQIVPI